MEINRASGPRVAYIARCVGGVFALDRDGQLVWRFDVGYVTSFETSAGQVVINGVAWDVDRGPDGP